MSYLVTTVGAARKIAPFLLIFVLIPAACDEDGMETGENTRRAENTEQAGSPRGVRTVASYPLPGRPFSMQGIAYQESTGDFFVGSSANGAVFRGNVSDDGQEAEVFLEPGTDGRSTAAGMKVDEAGRLFIAGGDTAKMFVYDAESGDLIRTLDTPEAETTFINDVTTAPNGDAYFTDPERPAIFKVPVAPDGGVGNAEEWFVPKFPPVPDKGFNIQGIVATGDGRYLIAVQSNVGALYRIDLRTEEIREIDLGEVVLPLASGAGLVLDGQTLYAARGRADTIATVELSEDFLSGEVGESFANPAFEYPTTIAKVGDRLLVVDFLEPTVTGVEIP